MFYLISSVVAVGVEDRPLFGDLGRATAWRLSSGVNLVSPRVCRTEGLPMAKGGVVTGSCHPARS